ncbi:NADP-dependent malic enzyme [Liquorilactobacillus nagelii]|jgi:malate dehydrogenase (oxaloacetate-decarboxylating)|uniref:NAD(P)-dependent malic enzyme n=1 Tax=Liquorilactobacillus nagelii TaxID=82688 RepID=UPI0024318082|nr:NADP-dependent malic enzyme [Liquorilactobacillus nagelii]MCI1699648.1 NADP-dependent malic enzyme [Liquorilactobacillus nagelii]
MAENIELLHEKHTGVLEVEGVLPVDNREELGEAYTPGVAKLSKLIAKNPSLKVKYTVSGKLVAVITDGTAVLGLGNVGPEAGLPVVEGKALLYKQLAGVTALPLCLNQVKSSEMVTTIKNISKSFSGIHLEDIAAPRCFEIEEQLKKQLNIPVYHDDQEGTAIVVLAGLFNAAKVVNKSLKDLKILINGVGAAGVATAKLLLDCGVKKLTLVDKYGSIDPMDVRHNTYQRDLAAKVQQKGSLKLSEAITDQDVFIGLSDANVLTAEDVKKMAADPIIFALANPVPEILPETALNAGAKIVATGSSQYPNQINNILVFPGLFRGLLESHLNNVDFALEKLVAQTLADLVPKPTNDDIIPGVFDLDVAKKVSDAVANYKRV